MTIPIDDRALGALIEQSDDLHADAMRETRVGLADMVDRGHEIRAHGGYDPDQARAEGTARRRALLAAGAAGGAGAALLTVLGAQAAFADTPSDIAAAQTAASIEALAIAVYGQAAKLPFMANIPAPAGPTVVAFVTKTVQQHTDHLNAFNAAAANLGGKKQTSPDQVVLDKVVTPALPTLKTPLDVVKFAAVLEEAAAQTYAVATATVTDKMLRSTFASITGVESQHVAVLNAVAALLAAGHPELVTLSPTNVASLPAAAGSVGFSDGAFLKTDSARPLTEGAVK